MYVSESCNKGLQERGKSCRSHLASPLTEPTVWHSFVLHLSAFDWCGLNKRINSFLKRWTCRDTKFFLTDLKALQCFSSLASVTIQHGEGLYVVTDSSDESAPDELCQSWRPVQVKWVVGQIKAHFSRSTHCAQKP